MEVNKLYKFIIPPEIKIECDGRCWKCRTLTPCEGKWTGWNYKEPGSIYQKYELCNGEVYRNIPENLVLTIRAKGFIMQEVTDGENKELS